MSSEPEENPEHPEKQTVDKKAFEGDISSANKDNGPIEHAKPKRRRRGKKRKHKKESAATCESETVEDGEVHAESEHENPDSPPWDSDEDLSCDVDSFTDVIIRPINVPKAPENSTQFIMDDHNECRLYMSFETPNPYVTDPSGLQEKEGVIVEPVGEDAAYRDIDYEYESPQDFDNSAYYDREFEQSYKSNRLDELMRLPRTELIGMLHSLESRSKELNDDLVKENPSPMLDKLQHELLQLQEKHNYLQQCNERLTGLVGQQDNVNNATLDSSSSLTVSQDSISHSDGDLCKDYSDNCEPLNESRSESESENESRNVDHFSEMAGDSPINNKLKLDLVSEPSQSDIIACERIDGFDSPEPSFCVDDSVSDTYDGCRSEEKFTGVVPCEEFAQNLLSSE